jgi:hypothetical protein
VISESQARESRRRVEQTNAKIDALLKAKRRAGGVAQNGAMPEPMASSQMVLAPITMPADEPSQGWWSQLTSGSNTREIDKQTAIEVCRIILRDTLGGLVAQATPIDFDQSEPITLRDLHAAIQELAGAKGWSVLLKKGGHG